MVCHLDQGERSYTSEIAKRIRFLAIARNDKPERALVGDNTNQKLNNNKHVIAVRV